jgi:hypothetical protein
VDNDVGCRSELQQGRFEVVVFVLEVEVEFGQLAELVGDFVDGRLHAVEGELEFDP